MRYIIYRPNTGKLKCFILWQFINSVNIIILVVMTVSEQSGAFHVFNYKIENASIK